MRRSVACWRAHCPLTKAHEPPDPSGPPQRRQDFLSRRGPLVIEDALAGVPETARQGNRARSGQRGVELHPGLVFPIRAAADDRRVGAGGAELRLVLDVVSDQRLITARGPGWAVVAHRPSKVHYIGEHLDFLKEPFAGEVVSPRIVRSSGSAGVSSARRVGPGAARRPR